MRDEAAETVWAIGQTALGPVGLPVDRTANALAHFMPLTPTPNDGAALPARTYLLRTDRRRSHLVPVLSRAYR